MKILHSFSKRHLLQFAILPVILLLSPGTRAQIAQGLYTIKLAPATTVLDASLADMDRDGCKVQTWAYLGGANQHWKIVPSRSVAGTFNIRLAGTGRALDAAWHERFTNGGRIILWNFNDGESQRWRVEQISGNRYRVRLAVSNKLATGAGTANGSLVHLWDQLGTAYQEWIIEKVNRITVSEKYVDLRPNQTGIRNQGGRGSCTSFGATAALEAAYKKAGYGNLDLSEEFFSMLGKALYLHPVWADVERKGAASTENQMSGTQGGGTVFIFKSGFALPKESDVPYRSSVAADSLWNRPEYSIQRNMNNYNFSLNTPNVLKAPAYYGARAMAKLANPRNAAEYEQLLRQGYEIHFGVDIDFGSPFVGGDGIWRRCSGCTSRGAHNMLIVGFDKTDPDPRNHYFIVKNSWGPSGIPGSEGFNYMHYDYLNYTYSAEYINSVNTPRKWLELGLLGEYSLDFDGWRGRLDIYHLPGVFQWEFDNRRMDVTDRRLGIFYDQSGNAFRVNGSVRWIINELLEVTFYLNNARPNPRWDELGGRRFVYYYDYRTDFMAGFHTDPGSTVPYAGYAQKVRNSFIANTARTPRPFSLASYKNSSWKVNVSSGPKGKLYISQSGSTLSGTFYNDATRSVSDVRIAVTNAGFTQMEFNFDGYALKGQHLTWENGLISGFDLNSKKPFFMVRLPPQVPDLTWARVGNPLSGQAIDICACNDGSLYALKSDKTLYKSTTGGSDASWVYQRTLPLNTRQIACARNFLYYQVMNATGTSDLYYIENGTAYRTASLAGGAELAGTEDNTLDFPYLYQLNSSRELFRSSTNGSSWTRIGHPASAARIAATQNALFALNGNGSFWINRYGGSDANWAHIDDLPQAADITATSLGQTGRASLYFLHHDRTLWRTTVFDDTLGYQSVTRTVEPAAETGFNSTASGQLSESSLTISPNPASNIVTIRYKGEAGTNAVLRIHDSNGRLVKQMEAAGRLEEQVNVSGWPKGIYMVSLVSGQGKVAKKLFVR